MKKRWLMVAIMAAVLVLGGCGKSEVENSDVENGEVENSEVEKLRETYADKISKANEEVSNAYLSGSDSEVEKAKEERSKLGEEYVRELQKSEAERIQLKFKTIGADTLQTPDTIKICMSVAYGMYISEPVAEFKTDEYQIYDFEAFVGESYHIYTSLGERMTNYLEKANDGTVFVIDYEKQEFYVEDKTSE